MTDEEREQRLNEARWTLGRAMMVYAILTTPDANLRAERIGEALDLGAITYREAAEFAK